MVDNFPHEGGEVDVDRRRGMVEVVVDERVVVPDHRRVIVPGSLPRRAQSPEEGAAEMIDRQVQSRRPRARRQQGANEGLALLVRGHQLEVTHGGVGPTEHGVDLQPQLPRPLLEGRHPPRHRAVVRVRAHHRHRPMSLLRQIVRRQPAVLLVRRLDVVAGISLRAARHKPDVRQVPQACEHRRRRLYPLQNEAIEFLAAPAGRQFLGRVREQHPEVDPQPRIVRLRVQQLVVEPVEAGIVGPRAHEPDADPPQLRRPRLRSAPPAQRRRHVVVRLHHRPDPRQTVRRDNLRLVDRPRHRRGRDPRFLRDLRDQHTPRGGR